MTVGIVELYRSRMTDLLQRATKAMAQMSDAEINWRPNEESNSVANLVIHLEGNLQHFVEAGIGGAESRRNRDMEFNSREFLTREAATERLRQAIERTDAVLAALTPERMDETVPWNKRDLPIRELILILTVHLGEHVGQILYIAKLCRGGEYQMASIAHTPAAK